MYTLEDLTKAKEELAHYERCWDNYSGNNPNKYRTDIQRASSAVWRITQHLKDTGVLPRTEQEEIHYQLDKAFPKAASREIVEFNGKKYQRQFFPLETSRRGNVKSWGKRWIELKIQQGVVKPQP